MQEGEGGALSLGWREYFDLPDPGVQIRQLVRCRPLALQAVGQGVQDIHPELGQGGGGVLLFRKGERDPVRGQFRVVRHRQGDAPQ